VAALLPLIRRDTNPPGEHSIAFLDSKVNLVEAAAAASTERYKQGRPLGPLDGVPIAVKDEVELEGYKKSLGRYVHPIIHDDISDFLKRVLLSLSFEATLF
jgi:Asp-tRNA(Asn)/Glu-tRNA(Gln) amidotransferase A subunit family amidase